MLKRYKLPITAVFIITAAILSAATIGYKMTRTAIRATATEYYVSPSGSASGDGSQARPWDLQTALSHPVIVRGGDTIWLRGGTYKGACYTSKLTGAVGSPITVRQYPGERAIIDGVDCFSNTLTVNGSWTWYWGFEVTDSDPNRVSTQSGGGAADLHTGEGVTIFAPNTKFINMIVHDATGDGMGFWRTAWDSEIYGTLIYNNGFDATDRGHGHAIYTQNDLNKRYISDNIMFSQASYGLHAYTEGGWIDHMNVEGNVSFINGAISMTGLRANLLIGGLKVAQNPVLINNYTYHPLNTSEGHNNVGWSAGCTNPTIKDNYFVGGGISLRIVNCTGTITMTGNTMYNYQAGISGFTTDAYPSNTYILNSKSPTGTIMAQPKTFIRPNRYEPNRSNVIIYNLGRQTSVPVDVSGVLKPNDTFELRDYMNFFGTPILSGTYIGGSINVPMTSTAVAMPTGNIQGIPKNPAPEFGAFALLKTSATTTTPTPSPSPTLAADFNGDGQVNISDLSILASNWGRTGANKATGDANGDGQVNISDLSILANQWGRVT